MFDDHRGFQIPLDHDLYALLAIRLSHSFFHSGYDHKYVYEDSQFSILSRIASG